jgi:ABC-2 type transport system ATP-binding protein
MNALQIENVSKHYANHTALNKVSFNVKQGVIFGLLGPNGAGKTSLIRIINQITGPDEGGIKFYGEPLTEEHIKEIGYLPEERGLYKKMSVYDQLLYFARLRGMDKKKAKETINHWLEKFEATTWAKKKIEELSKGMQQKIQFITTVLHNPRLIILDEPFTGFDPKNTEVIKNEILRLRDEGATVMLSTHRMENVEAICDEMVLISRSEVVANGTINEIRNSQKDNSFEVLFRGEFDASKSPEINVKSIEKGDDSNRLIFEYKTEQKTIQTFSNQSFEILEYRERIPSMQDVFISLTSTKEEE